MAFRTVLALFCVLTSGIAVSALAAAPGLAELQKMTARFAPVDVKVDIAHLPANERQALVKMIQAAQVLDAVFLRQASPRNEARLLDLLNDRSPLGQARLTYFMINKGPWSELDENRAFLPGVETKPQQGNFYPVDATRAEVDAWMNTLSKEAKEAAVGFFTTIRRTPQGKLTTVPY